MTIGYIVIIVIIGVIGVISTIAFFNIIEPAAGIIALIITIALIAGMIFGGLWYFNSTANGIRALKDQESNLNNGIKREITITAEDGREIYHYIGKCDIETNAGYILFEDEDGLRQMVYWGVQDTIIVKELED